VFRREVEALPVEHNIVYKAAHLFYAACKGSNCGTLNKPPLHGKIKIHVTKRIPQAAGLGGASSCAAASLLALNDLTGGALPQTELLKLAAELGSDVPFFLHGGGGTAALVEGRGEKITYIPKPPLACVLVNSGFRSNTGAAYALLDEYRARGRSCRKFISDAAVEVPELLKLPCRDWNFYNDFLEVFLQAGGALADGALTGSAEEALQYKKIDAALRENGALFTSISGSGSTYFGVFANMDEALRAEKKLSGLFLFVKALG
jgi:4-diphosphocytidyl-2-C-methyl-D-erythritol kinase